MNAGEITVMIAWRGAGGRLAVCSNLASKGLELTGPWDVAASVYLGREHSPPFVGANGLRRLMHDRLSLSPVLDHF